MEGICGGGICVKLIFLQRSFDKGETCAFLRRSAADKYVARSVYTQLFGAAAAAVAVNRTELRWMFAGNTAAPRNCYRYLRWQSGSFSFIAPEASFMPEWLMFYLAQLWLNYVTDTSQCTLFQVCCYGMRIKTKQIRFDYRTESVQSTSSISELVWNHFSFITTLTTKVRSLIIDVNRNSSIAQCLKTRFLRAKLIVSKLSMLAF